LDNFVSPRSSYTKFVLEQEEMAMEFSENMMERKISKIIENFQCFYEDTFKCLFALKGCGLTV
jgi:hypothetical protein